MRFFLVSLFAHFLFHALEANELAALRMIPLCRISERLSYVGKIGSVAAGGLLGGKIASGANHCYL